MTSPKLPFRNIHTVVFDFDGVFTDNSVYVNDSGEESVRCSRADSFGISLLNRAKASQYPFLDFFVLSTEKSSVVSARCLKMGINFHSGIDDKLNFLEVWLRENRSSYSDANLGVAYFGNDLNDLGAMSLAGTTFAPADAHQIIKHIATHNLKSLGGQGFVREGIELILGIEAMNLEEVNEFISHR